MANLTSVGITSGVPTSGTGTVSTIDNLIAVGLPISNGTNTAAIKAASTAPVAADPGLVVSISPNSVNANGQATMANSAPVVLASNQSALPVTGTFWQTTQPVSGSITATVAPSTTDVSVTPAVTASSYTANNCIGGIMTFASILAATSFNGILQSITAKFKATVVTGTINVHVFKASPSNGTYTDKTAVTWNGADMANLIGVYQLTAPLSTLGTQTTYNLDGIGKAIAGASTSLFIVATVAGTPSPASTSDFTLELAVLPG